MRLPHGPRRAPSPKGERPSAHRDVEAEQRANLSVARFFLSWRVPPTACPPHLRFTPPLHSRFCVLLSALTGSSCSHVFLTTSLSFPRSAYFHFLRVPGLATTFLLLQPRVDDFTHVMPIFPRAAPSSPSAIHLPLIPRTFPSVVPSASCPHRPGAFDSASPSHHLPAHPHLLRLAMIWRCYQCLSYLPHAFLLSLTGPSTPSILI
ncbi:hypothetical protein C8R44DRAFT_885514 [Mycena epipterygia]|nr:hypothetical protein C8R44DRAFT_885514 [Mycena epipterygia]